MAPDAVTPVTRGTEAELPDSGEHKAMPPVAGEFKAVLPDPGKPRAMPPFAKETEAVLPESGETQAMLPVVKPKPLPDGLTLLCKTPQQPATAPPQSSNVEKLKLPPTTPLFEQEPWDPSDILVLSNKTLPQPATAPPPLSNDEKHCQYRQYRQLCLRRGNRQTLFRQRRRLQHPQYWRRQLYRRCMNNIITNTGTVSTMWATSLPMSALSMPYSRHFGQHLHRHRRRDKHIAGMRKTSSLTSGPYGWPFHQHLHRQAGNGSLPPSAPKTPPTYAQMTSHTGNGSLPLSAPKTDGKVYLRCQQNLLQLLASSILYHHHGSGGSCVASQYYALDCVAHYQARTLHSTRSVMIIS
jgi:hypothetical protein